MDCLWGVERADSHLLWIRGFWDRDWGGCHCCFSGKESRWKAVDRLHRVTLRRTLAIKLSFCTKEQISLLVYVGLWWWLFSGSNRADISGTELAVADLDVSPRCSCLVPLSCWWSLGAVLQWREEMMSGKQEAWLGCTLGPVAFCSLAPFLF